MFESGYYQPGEGPSSGLLRDYEHLCGPSFQALGLFILYLCGPEGCPCGVWWEEADCHSWGRTLMARLVARLHSGGWELGDRVVMPLYLLQKE